MALLVVSFIAGVLTVLAPCILPVLPVILGGAAADAGNKHRPLVIIGSLAVSVFVFTLLLKVSTAFIMVPPSFWAYVSAVILFAFGLTLLFPEAWAKLLLKLPGHGKADSWLARGYKNRGTLWGDVLIGAALGPIFTTCSPTFFVILATVLPQSLVSGLIHLVAYVLGLALILLLIARLGQRLVSKLEWAANPYGWFKKILGMIFIILAVLIATGIEKKIETAILDAGFFDVTRLERAIQSTFDRMGGRPATSSEGFRSGTPYTEIENPSGFVNTEGITIGELVGKKVVIVDFMTYSCINCQRTFPYMAAWYDKYKDQGLEIIGIHTPEFAFEKDINNVRWAMRKFGIEYPVVLDNDYATWNAYGNRYWPRKYLIDIHGNVVYDHIGEGAYEETEMKIKELLMERAGVLGESGPVAGEDLAASRISGAANAARSPETYFGSLRNRLLANGSRGRSGEQRLVVPQSIQADLLYLGGTWNIQLEYAESVSDATVVYEYNAREVYIVADADEPVEVEVWQDGKPVGASAGADVDQNGKVLMKESGLYRLVNNPEPGAHILELRVKEKGLRFYAFTFG